ncbi:MAG: ARMT1-like domain-containing protein [Planctomycetota bacterium]
MSGAGAGDAADAGGAEIPGVDPAVSRAGYGAADVHPFDGVLPQLADAAGYTPCGLDLAADEAGRGYWLGLFDRHIASLAEHAVEEAADAGGDAAAVGAAMAGVVSGFRDWLKRCAADPAGMAAQFGEGGRLTILDICYERERRLRAAGVADPYRLAKERETEAAVAALPALLGRLDAMDEAERADAVTRGVFAGNIFDLGASETATMFRQERVDFAGTLGRLKGRPWLVDDGDAWVAAMRRGWGCALVFVDNAGPDVVLGMLPLVRELLRRCGAVIVAANTFPSLNDVTIDELGALVERVAAGDAELAAARRDGRLVLVGSGNGAPLIDLRRLSPELVELAGAGVGGAAVDLVVLEGMGRGVESNWEAAFATDVLKVCMVKDAGVAAGLGGELFDLVLKFEPAGGNRA